MKQAVLRKTLSGSWEKFSFDKVGRFYLVKNLSSNDCLVSFEDGDIREDECIKIKKGITEKVAISHNVLDSKDFYVKDIYVKGMGEIEVQSLDISRVILPRLSLSVESYNGDEDLFGKVASDLQEDIVVGASAIEGKLKYISDYTGFSSNVEEQSGHYIVLKATANNGASITGQVIGGTHGAVTLDSDGLIVCRIVSNEQSIQFVATTELETKTVTLALTDLVLEEAPVVEEPVEETPVVEEPNEEPQANPSEE